MIDSLHANDGGLSDSQLSSLSRIADERELLEKDWKEFLQWRDLKLKELEQWKIDEHNALELLK